MTYFCFMKRLMKNEKILWEFNWTKIKFLLTKSSILETPFKLLKSFLNKYSMKGWV
jgi:hypothetical protein